MQDVQPKAMTVTELNKYVKDMLDSSEILQNVLIKGELSNFKLHYTGHMYFTLKDKSSLIKGVMFKTYAGNLKFKPEDGMSVIIYGSVSVFERDGIYQIYAKDMMLDGIGALYAEFEKLKTKLQAQGMFDETHKKAIPHYVETVGVISSKTGSVIQDILNVSKRRNPNIHIKLFASAVQGEGAKEQIAHGIGLFNRLKNVDVIILARGGGSLEDLWPFNEEMVANAIYNSEIPVISAVGHETDFSISDFVADLRAPTPSAAAELAVFDVADTKWKIQNYSNSLRVLLNKKLEITKNRYKSVLSTKPFTQPLSSVQDKYQIIDNLVKELKYNFEKVYNNNKTKFIEVTSILDSISPLKTLQRGYAIVANKDGQTIKSVKQLNVEDIVNVNFVDGNRNMKVI